MIVAAVAGCSSVAAEVPMTTVEVVETVPVEPELAADRGCLDEAGTLDASADGWYPRDGVGWLRLNGDHAASAALDAFEQEATQALAMVAPSFVLSDGFEYVEPQRRCVTHRNVWFAAGDDDIVVSAWRVESAASPHWVPTEAPFESIDDSTLGSSGEHVSVVLAVAPDGTTARVAAYGAGAAARTSGWPTTTPPPRGAPEPGPASLTTDDLIPVAHDVLTFVLGQR
jgi:hypothetical protein